MRIAVVGSGVSGLVCAHLLDPTHEVTLFEADSRLGGHTNTVDVEFTRADGRAEHHAVDTGFIVFNERNYPHFVELLNRLGVASQPSEMSFSVHSELTGLEYRGTNLDTLYAQRSNLLRLSFHRMLVDIVRFNRAGRRLLADGAVAEQTLAAMVDHGRYSRRFVEEFLIPLGSAIWSADPSTFLQFPAATYARFMDNHGLLALRDRPQWRTISGGSRTYVTALAARLRGRVRLNAAVATLTRRPDPDAPLGTRIDLTTSGGGTETYDAVVLALHSDDALRILGDPSAAEQQILGAMRYQRNIATLHTDERFLPRRPKARASWNYHLGAGDGRLATLTYWMNRLQSIESSQPLLVTLNCSSTIDERHVLAQFDYAHPVFDSAAVAAQGRRHEIQGERGTFYAGAYWGYGFHEDGVASALDVCRHFGVAL